MHVSADHKSVRYSCSICAKQFKRKGSLGRHLAGTHGQGRLEMFKCQVCSKEFKQKSHLKTHLKNLHSIITPSAKEQEHQRQQQATAQAVIQQTSSTTAGAAGQPQLPRAVTQPVTVIKTAQGEDLFPFIHCLDASKNSPQRYIR